MGRRSSRRRPTAVRAWLEDTVLASALHPPPGSRSHSRTACVRRSASETSSEVRRIELSSPEELADLDSHGRVRPSTSDCPDLRARHAGRLLRVARNRRLRGARAWTRAERALDLVASRWAPVRGECARVPVGIHLGRLTPDDAPHAVARALAGLIELERYRGRTAYAQPVQAGERAVREAGGFFEVSDLRLVEADGDRARFRSPRRPGVRDRCHADRRPDRSRELRGAGRAAGRLQRPARVSMLRRAAGTPCR